MIKGITRIAISGVESTGKTTLAVALSKALGAEVAFEAARTDPRVRAGTIELPDLKRLAKAQWQACLAAEDRASKSQSSAVISDTDSTVIRMWGRWAFRAEITGLEDPGTMGGYHLALCAEHPLDCRSLEEFARFERSSTIASTLLG